MDSQLDFFSDFECIINNHGDVLNYTEPSTILNEHTDDIQRQA